MKPDNQPVGCRLGLIMALVVSGLMGIGCQKEPGTKDNKEEVQFSTIYEANAMLSPGINLGNALEAPNEGEWGVTIKDEYLSLIKAAGFRAVRLPVRWSAHAAAEAPYTIDAQFMQRVKYVIDLALAQGLTVVFNVHHYEEIFKTPAEQKTRFMAIWQQLAQFYRDYPAQLYFELLNEPHEQLTAELWNQYFEEARQLVRQSNPTRPIVVGTAEWGGLYALDKLNLNPADTNLIVTIHYYEPFQFTHQGAEWVSGSNAWLGTTWSGTPSQIQAMTNHFIQIKNWGQAHNRPIYIGEFGAYQKADMTSRSLWTAAVVNLCRQYGFSYAYWEFCSGFGAYDPVAEKWRDPLLQALIPKP